MLANIIRKIKYFTFTVIVSMGIGAYLVTKNIEKETEEVDELEEQTVLATPAKEWKKYPTVAEMRETVTADKHRIAASNANLSIGITPYTLFFLMLAAVLFYSYSIGWYRKKQDKVNEEIYYKNRVEDFVESSRHSNDKEVVKRAQEKMKLLKKYGNDRVKVHIILYNSDPDHIGETFEDFEIRKGIRIGQIKGKKYKEMTTTTPAKMEAFLAYTKAQQGIEADWQEIQYH